VAVVLTCALQELSSNAIVIISRDNK